MRCRVSVEGMFYVCVLESSAGGGCVEGLLAACYEDAWAHKVT